MEGFVFVPLAPLRVDSREQSEMCSQLLYGECVDVLEVKERWLFVANKSDGYKGWIDRKMIHLLADEEKQELSNADFKCIQSPFALCRNLSNSSNILLPGGSFIPYINDIPYYLGGRSAVIDSSLALSKSDISGDRIVQLAEQYLNAPYLWGGKSILGIDCSGLVQVVYAMCNMQLPRDASMQVDCGSTIDFLTEARTGDLAFFENLEGRIVHVGILLNSHQIIHASGWVKIDNIDSQGIISSETGEYSHFLRIIKRLI